jgi:cystathionine gamma-lyase
MIWAENPGNPLLSLVDIPALAAIAHRHQALLGIDNTFATPVATQPLKLGADIVMHSATKYLGGHSDLLGGAIVVKDRALLKELYFIQNATGGVMAPLDCYLCARGIKTLEVRFREQCKSALWIAQFLENHPAVKKVYYPGLASHPQHELAQKQLRGLHGAVVSFELNADFQAAKRFVSSTRFFQRAVSMGAVESLIEQPASMSHASYDKDDRLKAGIEDGLIRLSVGLEHPKDLIEDLQGAFAQALELDAILAPSIDWDLEAGYFS